MSDWLQWTTNRSPDWRLTKYYDIWVDWSFSSSSSCLLSHTETWSWLRKRWHCSASVLQL